MQHGRWFRIFLALAAVSAFGAACALAVESPATRSVPAEPRASAPAHDRVPGEWLVRVAPGVTAERLTELYLPQGIIEARAVTANVFLLRFPPHRAPSEDEIRRIGAASVVHVQPNFRYRTLSPH